MNQKGFTFIEILVVTTIIGILATIGLTSYQIANKKARDGKRKADLEQIRSALEMCRADTGAYPLTLDLSGCGSTSYPLTCGTNTYLQAIPCDPIQNTTYKYVYAANGTGTAYSITATLEIGPVFTYIVTNP